MRIVTVRRISQVFFLAVFLWFCVTATLGAAWYQLRGWPINWLLDLDPLTALATVLATGTLYATLAWALVTLVLTLFVGRFFCGFACPLGTLHQFTGWLGRLGHSLAEPGGGQSPPPLPSPEILPAGRPAGPGPHGLGADRDF